VGADGQLAYTLGGDNPFSYFPKSVERLMPVVRDIVTGVSDLQNRKALIQNLGTSLNTSDRLDFKVLWNSYEREYHSPEERALYNTDLASYSTSSADQSFFISNGDQRNFIERYEAVGLREIAGLGVSYIEARTGTVMQLSNAYNASTLTYDVGTSSNRGTDFVQESTASLVGLGVDVVTKCIGCDLAPASATHVAFTYVPDVNTQALMIDMRPMGDQDLSNISIGVGFEY